MKHEHARIQPESANRLRLAQEHETVADRWPAERLPRTRPRDDAVGEVEGGEMAILEREERGAWGKTRLSRDGRVERLIPRLFLGKKRELGRRVGLRQHTRAREEHKGKCTT